MAIPSHPKNSEQRLYFQYSFDLSISDQSVSRPPTPPPTVSRKAVDATTLPSHLTRLLTIQSGLQHALSHALATCAVSPTSDTGIVRNVLNHLSLTTYTGLTTQFSVDDLRRLCWLWEWDGKTPQSSEQKYEDVEDNPFLDDDASSQPKDWTRGSMGIVLSPATHYSKSDKRRVPAYGIGIEVEMDIDKDMGGGMAAVARWTAAAETRRTEFRAKIVRWTQVRVSSLNQLSINELLRKIYSGISPVPQIPLADLPQLAPASNVSSLTHTLAAASPKSASSPFKLPAPPASPSRSPLKSPTKRSLNGSGLPLSLTPLSRPTSPVKNSIPFPQTPSRKNHIDAKVSTPRTPRTSLSEVPSEPSTPVHQRGAAALTAPPTPATSRRQALYDRVRQKSLTASPTKGAGASGESAGVKLTRDQMLKLGQDEMRKRCLLGRLGGVAESAWMSVFSQLQ